MDMDFRRTSMAPVHYQRQISAHLHTINNLRNKLTVIKKELEEEKKENRLLNRLKIRQEKDLNKYISQDGELPQILQRHSEEVIKNYGRGVIVSPFKLHLY